MMTKHSKYKKEALAAHKRLVKRLHTECYNRYINPVTKHFRRLSWLLDVFYIQQSIKPKDLAISANTVNKVMKDTNKDIKYPKIS